MRKKMLCAVLMTLLIAAAVFPSFAGTNDIEYTAAGSRIKTVAAAGQALSDNTGKAPDNSSYVFTDGSAAGTAAIEKIEEDIVDADGNTTINVTVAESVMLPLELTLKGTDQTLRFSISYNGQAFKVRPGTYEVEKAVGGDGKKLSKGAFLAIPEEGGEVYLDFTKPKSIFDGQLKNFVIVNVLFVLFVLIAVKVFTWYRKSIA